MTNSALNSAALDIDIYADGADLEEILRLYENPLIKGFTTNPTLMRKVGITDYPAFAREVLSRISDRPFSFEVLSDEFEEMERQAHLIASWGGNVYVKIPVTNTRGQSSAKLVQRLTADGVRVNVTALLTLGQVREVSEALLGTCGGVVSVFAGRIADTGRDPVPLMRAARELLDHDPNQQLLWASPREILNVIQAAEIGCDIITVTHDLLKKLAGLGKRLDDVSLETVKMFVDDAVGAGYQL